jgi:hypothetical protein
MLNHFKKLLEAVEIGSLCELDCSVLIHLFANPIFGSYLLETLEIDIVSLTVLRSFTYKLYNRFCL